MDKCLVTTLQGTANITEAEYFNSMRVKVIANSRLQLRPTATEALTIIVESGTIYEDDNTTVAADAGSSFSIPANTATTNYRTKTATVFRIEDNNTLMRGVLLSGGFSVPTDITSFAEFINVENIDGTGTNWIGTIEEYVEKAVSYGKASGVYVSGDNISFNDVKNSNQQFYIRFNDNPVLVKTKYTGQSSYIEVGTYNKTTGEWTYV